MKPKKRGSVGTAAGKKRAVDSMTVMQVQVQAHRYGMCAWCMPRAQACVCMGIAETASQPSAHAAAVETQAADIMPCQGVSRSAVPVARPVRLQPQSLAPTWKMMAPGPAKVLDEAAILPT